MAPKSLYKEFGVVDFTVYDLRSTLVNFGTPCGRKPVSIWDQVFLFFFFSLFTFTPFFGSLFLEDHAPRKVDGIYVTWTEN